MSENKIVDGLDNLKDCTNLRILNLSKNKISSLESLKCLVELKNLTNLNLKLNPVVDLVDYKNFITNLLPNLTRLDESRVTSLETIGLSDEDDVINDELTIINDCKKKEIKDEEEDLGIELTEIEDLGIELTEIEDLGIEHLRIELTKIEDVEKKEGVVTEGVEDKEVEIREEYKENEDKETEVKENEVKESEDKETEDKETEVKENEVKENEEKEDKDCFNDYEDGEIYSIITIDVEEFDDDDNATCSKYKRDIDDDDNATCSKYKRDIDDDLECEIASKKIRF